MKTSDIKGIIPPVITPMNNDPEQTVNHQALRCLLYTSDAADEL